MEFMVVPASYGSIVVREREWEWMSVLAGLSALSGIAVAGILLLLGVLLALTVFGIGLAIVCVFLALLAAGYIALCFVTAAGLRRRRGWAISVLAFLCGLNLWIYYGMLLRFNLSAAPARTHRFNLIVGAGFLVYSMACTYFVVRWGPFVIGWLRSLFDRLGRWGGMAR